MNTPDQPAGPKNDPETSGPEAADPTSNQLEDRPSTPPSSESPAAPPLPESQKTPQADAQREQADAQREQADAQREQADAQREQAAQSEHKSESPADSNLVHGSGEPSDCALAGGADAPQAPEAGESDSPPPKKRRRKRRDNHVSVRFDDDEDDVIARRMEKTGETQSEAIRAIVRESEQRKGSVHIAPKAPPAQLENLLGQLAKWRRDFASAKPRLNIATPASDDSRYGEVQKWRKESDRLLTEIPRIEAAVSAARNALTSLTPERVGILRPLLWAMKKWRKARQEQKDKSGIVESYTALIELIEDMGISDVK